MIWRNPVAWLGLLTLLVPIVIHLLVRQQAASRPFPSLRFIQPSRLASVRRRLISDWPLLLVRLALLALAVAALADPFFQSAARRASWDARLARALVVDTSPSAGTMDERQRLSRQETTGTFRSATFETPDLAEGLARAADWLRTTPPARREIVLVSDFQLGALDTGMLARVPDAIGVRFVRLGGTPATRSAEGLPRTRRRAAGDPRLGHLDAWTDAWVPHVTVSARDTTVTWSGGRAAAGIARHGSLHAGANGTASTGFAEINLSPLRVRLRVSHDDSPVVLAAARAVLGQGIAFDGASDVANGTASAPRGASGTETATVAATTNAAVGHTTTTTTAMPQRGDITIAVTRGDAATLPADVSRLSAPWMSEVLRRIATDDSLSHAVSRARVAQAFRDDVPAPWLVLARDARGRPAILAAAAHGTATGRADERAVTRDGLRIVSRLDAADEGTALLLRATLSALAGRDPLREAEVLRLPDATLAQWQRPASFPPAGDWQDVESTDRRWLWAAVLALLVVEQVMRRRRRLAEAEPDHSYEHAA